MNHYTSSFEAQFGIYVNTATEIVAGSCKIDRTLSDVQKICCKNAVLLIQANRYNRLTFERCPPLANRRHCCCTPRHR